MVASASTTLVAQKLQAFARLEQSFESSFTFAQEIQGQRRCSGVPVRHIVCYLHALYVCAVKDRLLGIPRTGDRYEGQECLRLLREFYDGVTAGVIALLERKLDGSSVAELTRELESAPPEATPAELAQRARQLRRGRQVLLNRLANRAQALDNLCGLAEEDLCRQVRQACTHHGHTPRQIERQLAELNTPVYQTFPHPDLARRNMLVMARLGVMAGDGHAHEYPAIESNEHTMPEPPFAEEVIHPYYDLTPPWHNNPADIHLRHTTEILMPPPETGSLGQAQV